MVAQERRTVPAKEQEGVEEDGTPTQALFIVPRSPFLKPDEEQLLASFGNTLEEIVDRVREIALTPEDEKREGIEGYLGRYELLEAHLFPRFIAAIDKAIGYYSSIRENQEILKYVNLRGIFEAATTIAFTYLRLTPLSATEATRVLTYIENTTFATAHQQMNALFGAEAERHWKELYLFVEQEQGTDAAEQFWTRHYYQSSVDFEAVVDTFMQHQYTITITVNGVDETVTFTARTQYDNSMRRETDEGDGAPNPAVIEAGRQRATAQPEQADNSTAAAGRVAYAKGRQEDYQPILEQYLNDEAQQGEHYDTLAALVRASREDDDEAGLSRADMEAGFASWAEMVMKSEQNLTASVGADCSDQQMRTKIETDPAYKRATERQTEVLENGTEPTWDQIVSLQSSVAMMAERCELYDKTEWQAIRPGALLFYFGEESDHMGGVYAVEYRSYKEIKRTISEQGRTKIEAEEITDDTLLVCLDIDHDNPRYGSHKVRRFLNPETADNLNDTLYEEKDDGTEPVSFEWQQFGFQRVGLQDTHPGE